VPRNNSAAQIYDRLTWEIAGTNDRARTFGATPVDIETDVVVARFETVGFSGTQRLIPFGPSPRTN
jgi:hypothetical protein